MRNPSRQALLLHFSLDRSIALKAIFDRAAEKAGNDLLSLESALYFMQEVNTLLEMHGVVSVTSANRDFTRELLYANSGDSYKITIGYDRDVGKSGKFVITSMGDWIEQRERQGYKFD